MKVFSIVILICTLAFSQSFAAPDKAKTKFYLMKTNRMLGVAHMTVKRTKNFTGDLAKSVSHERIALRLYNEGAFQKAIYHSKRARMLCIKIYNDNKIKQPMDAKFNPEEEKLAEGAPLDEKLDSAVAGDLKDQDLVNGNLGVDISGAY